MPMPQALALLILLTTQPQVPAQAPALPRTDDATPSEAKPAVDLTNRYRFLEHYTTREEGVSPGLVGPYQVAIKETLRDTIESPDGRTSTPVVIVCQTNFNERPADVSSLGVVTATIRSYTRHVVRPDNPAGSPTLDGLTVWYRPRLNEPPLILSLSADRRLREGDYEIAAGQVFLPNLTALFPSYPVRVGDTWRVSRKTAQALFGDPEARGEGLVAKFAELKRDPDGKTSHAAIAVNGRVVTPPAESLVNAQIRFSFPTLAPVPNPGTTAPASAPRIQEGLIDARGAVSEIRLARVTSGPIPGAAKEGMRYKARQELILERKLGVAPKGESPVKLVNAPSITEANSWLTAVDPRHRFTFQHPQDLLPPDRYQFATPEGDNSILLTKNRPEGRDLIRIEVSDKPRTSESLKDILKAQWGQSKLEILPGEEGWLPAATWPNRKVFHVEAALKAANRNPRGVRIHYDAYLVDLGKAGSLTLIATTTRDAVGPFRRDVEGMLKTFQVETPGAN